jgi:hypothetical protein
MKAMKGTGLCFFDCCCYVDKKTLHNKSQEIAIGDNDTGDVVLLSSGHQMRHENAERGENA